MTKLAKKQMIRQAADNVYLHKDFHSALNFALIYLEKHHGEEGVREYLDQFAGKFYAPLRQAVKKEGLDPLEEHFKRIYGIEGGQVKISRPGKESLLLEVTVCPAVEHIRQSGNELAPLFHLTHEVVHSSICRGTSYQAEFSGYVPATGGYVQRFSRRES